MIRRLISSFAAAALVVAAASVRPQAQFKPTKPVEFVVHGGPGSGNDVFARALTTIIEQEKLAPVRFQVVNKPGGGGTTAAAYVVSKKGDPHVIACFTNVWLIDPLVQQAATNRLQDMSADRAAGGRAGAGRGARGFAVQDAGRLHRGGEGEAGRAASGRAARSCRARTRCASC